MLIGYDPEVYSGNSAWGLTARCSISDDQRRPKWIVQWASMIEAKSRSLSAGALADYAMHHLLLISTSFNE